MIEQAIDWRDFLQPGDVILTEGRIRLPQDLWPPYTIPIKEIVYNGIREYHRMEGYTYTAATHVRLVTAPNELFEVTVPRARFTDYEELRGKKIVICRPTWSVDMFLIRHVCKKMDGAKYDIGDLGDFLIAGLIGIKGKKIKIFGRTKRYVCSTGIAKALAADGMPSPNLAGWDETPPVWYANPDRNNGLFDRHLINTKRFSHTKGK